MVKLQNFSSSPQGIPTIVKVNFDLVLGYFLLFMLALTPTYVPPFRMSSVTSDPPSKRIG